MGLKLNKEWTDYVQKKYGVKTEDRSKAGASERGGKGAGPKKKRVIDRSKEDLICKGLDTLKIKYKRNYRFHKVRRFEFDIALPDYKIAIEFEGGIFSGGGHTRGVHYTSDCDKYNLATMNGWRVMRYTILHLRKNEGELIIADEIKSLITLIKNDFKLKK